MRALAGATHGHAVHCHGPLHDGGGTRPVTAVWADAARSSRSASRPVMQGIRTSMRIPSGARVRALASAASPSAASPTIVMPCAEEPRDTIND